MPTRQQIQFVADGLIDSKFGKIAAKQQNHILNRGHYWQAGGTHQVTPAHTITVWDYRPGDRLSEVAGDELGNWANTLPEMVGLDLPVNLRCDVYAGADGQGWVLVAQYRHDGILYERSLNVGPETHRERLWTAVEEG